MSPAAAIASEDGVVTTSTQTTTTSMYQNQNQHICGSDGGPKLLSPSRSASALTSTTASDISNSSSESSLDEEAMTAGGVNHNQSNDVSVHEYFTEEHVNHVNKIATKENETLNLNLGIPVDLTVFTRPDNDSNTIIQKVLRPPIQTFIGLLDRFLTLVENPLFQFWSNRIPLRLRQKLTFLAWGLYLPIHKALVGRRTGLHKNVSLEYHALTTIMWWGRLFPITIKRIRMSLSQLHVWHPPDKYPQWSIMNHASPSQPDTLLNKPSNGERYGIRGHVYEVYHQMKQKRTPTGFRRQTTNLSDTEMTVTGQYIQHASKPSQKVIIWIYGGAFLAGDSKGNLGIAEKMGMLCGSSDEDNGDDNCTGNEMRDVFIPDYRLVPENHLDDAIHDITLAYEYLVYERGIKAKDIALIGVSSGGGLVALLLQALAKAQLEVGKGDCSNCVPLPAGGVLMGPFVDYTEPKGSMKEYIKHDLIVNQAVYDEGIPYLEKVLGCHENRVQASPVYGNFQGLPPLCVCVSQHEVVYDQAMLLAKRAKEQGVDVTIGVWKYMCHVFPMLSAFVPEGQESFKFMCDWIKER